MTDRHDDLLLALTADIVAAYAANNMVGLPDLPLTIVRVHEALAGLKQAEQTTPAPQLPAVSIRASVKPDHIVCLEDGKKLKLLKRHLTTDHQMTPGQYRAKWNLPADYPMVAPNYAQRRRELAVEIGLGRRPGAKVATSRSRGRKTSRVS